MDSINCFDWEFYCNYYEDLRRANINTKEMALNHWNKYGKYEDRIINYNSIINNKINFIDGIIWINLDRSVERKNKMLDIFKNINIPNYRISAIDGRKLIIPNYNYERSMNSYEIACTLSHLKAIKFLSELSGNYFMICEDDICFNNICYLKNNLEIIIKNAPKFDILMIYKTYLDYLEDEYIDWNDHLNKYGMERQISGTCCYIISRDGINNILKKTDNFDVADMYLYKNTRTFVYKYNLVSNQNVSSEIHPEHLIFHSNSDNFQLKILLESNS